MAGEFSVVQSFRSNDDLYQIRVWDIEIFELGEAAGYASDWQNNVLLRLQVTNEDAPAYLHVRRWAIAPTDAEARAMLNAVDTAIALVGVQ